MRYKKPWDFEFSASPKWLLQLPRAAFVLFVAAVSALLWLSHQQDVEEQRTTLISDMLWLEQNMRFQMERNEELLGQLGSAHGDTAPNFDANSNALLINHTGLRQIFWVDLLRGKSIARPNATDSPLIGEAQGQVPSQSVLRLVQSLGRPAYTGAYPIVDNDWQIEVHAPVFRDGRPIAVAIGMYSLRRLVEESVPWWLAERYRIAVIDSAGKELVSRSQVRPVQANSSYELAFDPPGYGLLLSATPYQAPFRLLDRLLVVAIVMLAVATLASLWLVRKHVHRRIQAEGALRKEYLFRQAMERSVQTGLRARDLTGKVLYVNEAFCRMVGWSENELVGRSPPMPYWPPNALDEIRSVHDKILAGSGPTDAFELVFRRRSGESFTALIQESPLIDETGQQTGWMGSVVDISDRKIADENLTRQQERLQATTRLVALGEMASSLAHELNQPLAAISSYCSGALRLLRMQPHDRDVVDALAKAVEQTKRAGQIIRRIYTMAKREGGIPKPIDLGLSVRSVIALVSNGFKRQGVHIVAKMPESGPIILGDTILIEQALFNLLRNAADAMSDTELPLRCVEIRLGADGEYAHLSLADTGRGIPSEFAERIFDPLFTTKADGMGMGLVICRSVIEGHRGRLWVTANSPNGSVFHVLLPLA